MLAGTTTCQAQENKKKAEAEKYSGEVVIRTDLTMAPIGYGKGDVLPGKYVSKGGMNCKWELTVNSPAQGGDTSYKNTKGDHGGGKNTSVTIGKNDDYFTTTGCKEWRKAVK